MKIAVKHLALGSCLLALGMFAAPFAVHSYAQGAAPVGAPSAAPAANNAVPKLVSPATNAPTPNAPAPTVVAAAETKLPDLAVPLPTPGDKKDAKANDDKNVTVKVPDSVKDAIKKLNIKNEDVTLDDLNNAREAVAKLDALIDIEKRLVDLEKIKHEREENDKSALMAALPVSALTPPPAYMPPQQPQQMPVFTPPPANVDVVRIEGSNHHYAALIKEGENTRLVHAGEKLNDGTTVVAVTTKGVELQRGEKAARLVTVKDVQTVFGNTP